MAVPRVTLQADAVVGLQFDSVSRHMLAALPQEVALGRKAPHPGRKHLQLEHYHDKVTQPPPSINRRDKASASLARMYRNDVKGCCVISGKGHGLGVVSANDSDSGGVVLATDQEIDDQYYGVCGPNDEGCVITDVLDYMMKSGFMAGGRRYFIDGYVAADWTNQLLVKLGLYEFGCGTFGINLPSAWTQNAVWDVTNTRVVGGHDVTPIDYDETGVYVSSWGRIYRMTWQAVLSRRWVEELYFPVYQSWYNKDQVTPTGTNAAKLKADLQVIRSGGFPEIGPISPPPPKPPPSPPSPPVAPTLIDRLLQAHNAVRAKGGVGSLVLDPRLMNSAGKYAALMASNNWFGHQGPDRSTPWSRMAKEGFNGTAGENIAWGYSTPELAVAGWMSDGPHRRNVLDSNWNCVGFGAVLGGTGRWQGWWWVADYGQGSVR
jgi:uncharacterized protein YkwD